MKAIETMGTIINETSLLLDIPVYIKGKIKVLLLFEEPEQKPSLLSNIDKLLSFVGRFSKEDLIGMKSIIDTDCNRIDNEW